MGMINNRDSQLEAHVLKKKTKVYLLLLLNFNFLGKNL